MYMKKMFTKLKDLAAHAAVVFVLNVYWNGKVSEFNTTEFIDDAYDDVSE